MTMALPSAIASDRLPPALGHTMKRFRALLDRLPGGHRPPTGPLTTSEAAKAEELRQESLAKGGERIAREHEEAGQESNSTSS
jgi:hypothetical protein